MKARPAELRGDVERDLDELAQIRITVRAADLGEVMGRGRCEGRQPLDNLAAAGADVLPLHGDEPELSRVEEELDDGLRREPELLTKPDGVDPYDRSVVRRLHKRRERIDQVGLAGQSRSETIAPISEASLVHDGRCGFCHRRIVMSHGSARNPQATL